MSEEEEEREGEGESEAERESKSGRVASDSEEEKNDEEEASGWCEEGGTFFGNLGAPLGLFFIYTVASEEEDEDGDFSSSL